MIGCTLGGAAAEGEVVMEEEEGRAQAEGEDWGARAGVSEW